MQGSIENVDTKLRDVPLLSFFSSRVSLGHSFGWKFPINEIDTFKISRSKWIITEKIRETIAQVVVCCLLIVLPWRTSLPNFRVPTIKYHRAKRFWRKPVPSIIAGTSLYLRSLILVRVVERESAKNDGVLMSGGWADPYERHKLRQVPAGARADTSVNQQVTTAYPPTHNY